MKKVMDTIWGLGEPLEDDRGSKKKKPTCKNWEMSMGRMHGGPKKSSKNYENERWMQKKGERKKEEGRGAHSIS